MRLTVMGPNWRALTLHAPKDHPTVLYTKVTITKRFYLIGLAKKFEYPEQETKTISRLEIFGKNDLYK